MKIFNNLCSKYGAELIDFFFFLKNNMLFKIRSGRFCLPSIFWTNQCCLCMQAEALLSCCVDGSGGSRPSDKRGCGHPDL